MFYFNVTTTNLPLKFTIFKNKIHFNTIRNRKREKNALCTITKVSLSRWMTFHQNYYSFTYILCFWTGFNLIWIINECKQGVFSQHTILKQFRVLRKLTFFVTFVDFLWVTEKKNVKEIFWFDLRVLKS